MKVICIANQKGGVAKTATTAIMASALTKRGNKVLAVDMDPQGNLSKQVGAEDNGRGVYSVLRGDIAIQDAIQHFDRFDILPTNILLAGLEGELVSEIGRSFRLKNALKDSAVRDVYDYVLIDTPPSRMRIPTPSAVSPSSATRFSRQGSIATWTRKSSASCSPSSTRARITART